MGVTRRVSGRVICAVALAIAFRYACFAIMVAVCLWAEGRPAPHLPDLILDRMPYLPQVDRYNAWILLLCYLPLSLGLLWLDAGRFCRYTVTTGLLSLVRGACVALTGLGPVRGPDVNAGMPPERMAAALVDLLTPAGLLLRDAPHVYLTKDLFFSGHTGVTFLLLLYVWRHRPLRLPGLVGHVLVVASVFLAHLHYSIDVVGAYAVGFSLYALREWRSGPAAGAGQAGLGRE